MKLLVDSGSTKADWIAIDDNGKVLFTTQSLGLNPEVLTKEEIISRLEDKFDISHNKAKTTHLYFYGAGCGTDRMKNFLTTVLEAYFTNAKVQTVVILMELFCIKKYNHYVILLWMIVVVIVLGVI